MVSMGYRWGQRKMKQSMDMRELLRSSTSSPPTLTPATPAVALALFLLPAESGHQEEEDGLLFLQDIEPPAPVPAGGTRGRGRGGNGCMRLAAVVGAIRWLLLPLPDFFFVGDLTTDRAGGVLGEDDGRGRGAAEDGRESFLFFFLLLLLGSSTTTSMLPMSLQARTLRYPEAKKGPVPDDEGEKKEE